MFLVRVKDGLGDPTSEPGNKKQEVHLFFDEWTFFCYFTSWKQVAKVLRTMIHG